MKRAHLLIAAAALLASTPLFLHGPSCGHDFDFHLASWLDVQSAWRHGQFYPAWAPSANYGAGEPRFVFYPPLTWMLGAFLGLFLPWAFVPAAFTFVLLTLGGLATRRLATLFVDDATATLAGALSLFGGYTLFTAYERTAYGELAGVVWIPLLFYFALRTRGPARAFDGSAAWLALVVNGCWLSNAPLGVMACYLLALVALTAALVRRSWAPLLRAVVAVVLGIGLAAFFLVPAAYEQRWVNIRQATDDPGERIENSFLFAHHADPLLADHDAELQKVSALGTGSLVLIATSLVLVFRRRTDANWKTLAVVPAILLLAQLPISLFAWNLLPKLRFLQFPWRLFVALGPILGISLAAALVLLLRRRWLIALTAVAFCLLMSSRTWPRFSAYGDTFLQACDEEDAVPGMLSAYRSGAGFVGTDEYAPPAVDNLSLATGLPSACLADSPTTRLDAPNPASTTDNPVPPIGQPERCHAVYTLSSPSPGHYTLRAHIATPGALVLRLRSYPAWHLVVNGQPQRSNTRPDGLLAIPVAAGPLDLDIDWQTTADQQLGRVLSLLGAILLAALAFTEHRRSSQHLK